MAKPRTNTIVKRSLKESFELGRHDPVLWAWDFLGLDLHEGQQQFLLGSTAPGIKEGNLSAGNRYGKGEVIAPKILWSSFYQVRNEKFAYDSLGRLREYKAINVSVSLDQASIVFNKAIGYAQSSKILSPFIDRVVTSPFPELRFKPMKQLGAEKGAEVWARSTANGARYLLGQNFQYLNFDEAALEPNGETIVNDVIRMRMADSGGNIDTTTQPRGRNWHYYHFLRGIADSGVFDPGCYSQYGSSFDNPWIDHEHVKRSMKFMTEGQIQENVYGRHSDEDTFFPAEQVQRLYANQDYTLPIPPGHQIVWKHLNGAAYAHFAPDPDARNHVYVMGVDLAAKQDQTCIVVLRVDCAPWQMMHFELIGNTTWQKIKEKVTEVHRRYNGAWGLVDSTGAGGPILEDLQGGEFGCDFEGYNFGGTSQPKLDLLYQLQLAIQNREFVFPYYGETDARGTRPLVNQLTHYKLEDKKLRTDAVFGAALAVQAARYWIERSRIPPVTTPDIATVIVRVDRATGLPIIMQADDVDDAYDDLDPRQLARAYRHLAALL